MRKLVLLSTMLLGGCFHEPTCDPKSLTIGMSAEEVIALCGKPDYINTTWYSDYSVESAQWVYTTETLFYFKGGKLTTVQLFRHEVSP